MKEGGESPTNAAKIEFVASGQWCPQTQARLRPALGSALQRLQCVRITHITQVFQSLWPGSTAWSRPLNSPFIANTIQAPGKCFHIFCLLSLQHKAGVFECWEGLHALSWAAAELQPPQRAECEPQASSSRRRHKFTHRLHLSQRVWMDGFTERQVSPSWLPSLFEFASAALQVWGTLQY